MLRFLWCLCIICTAELSACRETSFPPGISAVVNGEPITLRQVEELHDARGDGLLPTMSPSVEVLRNRYGEALAALIVDILIRQSLIRAGLDVDEAEMHRAEAAVRADYPKDTFEKFLQEEYIDLESWRELLRRHLRMRLFREKVLRLRVRIDADEVSARYQSDGERFGLPRTAVVRLMTSPNRVEAEKVCAAWKEGRPMQTDGTLMQTLRLPYERFSPQRRKDLENTPPGGITPVREHDGLFQCMILLEIVPARRLSAVEAYSALEEELVEEKLEAAFDAWLVEALKDARIMVAGELSIPWKTVPQPMLP